ncbi:hypothetical protein MXB_1041 [Myxobolus squamalis]|nr:hypothetical protein MXB_1041 [Myxobolus squamalis]
MESYEQYEYMWADSTKKKPVQLPAPEYVDTLMNWINEQINDESIFPSTLGVPFPKVFKQVGNNIIKRMFRVYAHIYWHHSDDVKDLQEEPHLNTSFKHFVFFVQEFDMIEKKELAPLKEIIDKFNSSNN